MITATDFFRSTGLQVHEAVREYFRPIEWLLRYLKRYLRTVRDAFVLVPLRTELPVLRELKLTTDATHWEIQKLRHTFEQLEVRDARVYAALREFIQLRVTTIDARQAERASVKFISYAAALHSHGETTQALNVLRVLRRVGQKRHFKSTTYVLFNVGELLFQRSAFRSAEAHYLKVLEGPHSGALAAAASARIAFMHSLQEDLPGMVRWSERTITLLEHAEPDLVSDEACIRLATVLAEKGDVKHVAELLRRLVAVKSRGTPLLLPASKQTDRGRGA